MEDYIFHYLTTECLTLCDSDQLLATFKFTSVITFDSFYGNHL